MMTEFILLVVSALFLIAALYRRSLKNRKWEDAERPPGPSWWMILGLLPQFFQNPLETFQKQRQIFGPLFQLKLGPFANVLVICDPKIVKAAFRHPAFSDRIDLHFLRQETLGKGVSWSLGIFATEQRRFLIPHMKSLNFGETTIETKFQQEALELIQFLTNTNKCHLPITVNELFAPYVLNSFWGYVIGGQRFEPDDRDFLRLVYLITKKLNPPASFPEFLSNFFPVLAKFFPSSCNRKADALKEILGFIGATIADRKATWLKGQPRDLTDTYLDKVADTMDESSTFHEKNNFQRYTTSDLFVAAVHTVSLTLEWLMNYLSINPQVQENIFQEIDRVIGTSRLPCLQDRPNCQYVGAVIQELLRITALGPLGIPRQASEDTTFMGYQVPKGTIIMSTVHGIHHNPEFWDEPQKFCPERFLPASDGQLKKRLENLIPFGTGTRSCIGEGIARDSLFLFVTIICQRFIISLPYPSAKEVKPIFGISLEPEHFQVKFVQRKEYL